MRVEIFDVDKWMDGQSSGKSADKIHFVIYFKISQGPDLRSFV